MSKRMQWLLTAILSSTFPLTGFSDVMENPPAETSPQETPPKPSPATPPSTPLAVKPFTGKITRNKVRLRLQPNLEGYILKEINKDDYVIVVGESDEYYAVLPPKDLKTYVFRTYVLDNVVEGNRVNVRLDPDLDSPVIAQLTTGDKVEGTISPLNSKWLEIKTPDTVRLYVSKEYVEKVGDPSMMARLEKRRDEVNALLNSTYLISQSELQKPFEQINLDNVFTNFSKIVKLYSDFPEQVTRAKEMLAKIQETYLTKKIAYLETKAQSLDDHTSKLSPNTQNQLEQLERTIQSSQNSDQQESANNLPADESLVIAATDQPIIIDWNHAFDTSKMTDKMSSWVQAEKSLYDTWLEGHPNGTPETYYHEQIEEAVTLRGLVEPYHRTIRNKPGDYILVNKVNNLPIAYLYSTQINLQDKVGQEVTLKALPRPNNHFAFPAYFVVSVD